MKIKALGATAVPGSAEDLDALVRYAGEADTTVFVGPWLIQDVEKQTVSALLKAYAHIGKRFIFTSETGVLGQRTLGEWREDTFAEDNEFVPSKYLTTRRQTELFVRASSQNSVHAMVVRPPAIWGDGYPKRRILRVARCVPSNSRADLQPSDDGYHRPPPDADKYWPETNW